MDRFRLKNVIILILLLFNGFLLVSLSLQRSAEQSARQAAAVQLSALFAADGITLDPALALEEAGGAGFSLNRDEALEQEAAMYLLGAGLSKATQGGGLYAYTGAGGAAVFRTGGSFDAAGRLSDDAAHFCQRFCQKFGYSDPVYLLDDSGSGSAVSTRVLSGASVYNAAVTFSLDAGAVVAVSGILLPEPGSGDALTDAPLSALAALTAFQQARRESGAVVSRVTDITFCYELQSTVGASMRLTPAWRLSTDTATYYVNAVTGTVSIA